MMILHAVTRLKIKNQQSSMFLKALLNSNNVMSYIKDIQLKHITVNKIFLKTLSFSPNL